MAVFHSLGYIPVRMDLKNMAVIEVAIIPAAVLNSLLGILSRSVAFLSSIFFKRFNTISIFEICRENDQWSVVFRKKSGFTSTTGMSSLALAQHL